MWERAITGVFLLAMVIGVGLGLFFSTNSLFGYYGYGGGSNGTITGTVTDSSTTLGVSGVCVSAWRVGEGFAGFAGAVATASDGTYTLSGLPSNTYNIEFTDSGFSCPGGTNGNYITQWWNNKPDQNSADTVTVSAVSTVPNINAAMVLGGSITGTVYHNGLLADGLAGMCVFIQSSGGGGGGMGIPPATTNSLGQYSIGGLTTGNYFVEFENGSNCMGSNTGNWVTQWWNDEASQNSADQVSVTTGSPTPNINANMAPAGSIAGKVTAAADGSDLAGICVSVYATGGSPNSFLGNTPTAADGTYTFTGLDPAKTFDVSFDSSGNCNSNGTQGVAGNYVTQWYNDEASQGSADPVSVSAGVTTPNIDAAMVTTPDAPTSLTATAGYQQVALSWTAPASNGGSAITGYDVYEGTSAGHESVTPVNGSPVAPGTTSYTVTGLTEGTKYYFVVKAINAAGHSAASNEASATPAKTVAGAPTSLTATSGDTKVTLSWTAPTYTGGSSISGYDVYEGTSPGGESVTPVATGVASGYMVTGLSNGTTYYFTVEAVNGTGNSGPSNEASATPATLPGAPTGVTATAGNAQVTLSWTAPASDGGSSISGYDVYEGTSPGGESVTPVATGVTSGYIVTGLANGTTYYFTVEAVNGVGNSTASNEASATPATVPDAPTSLTATPGNNQVALSWTAPASDGGSAITGYDILRGTTSGGESPTPIATGVTGTTFTDTSATGGTTYYYEVEAVNSVGPSAASNEASATPTTPPPPPIPPLNGSVTSSVVPQLDGAPSVFVKGPGGSLWNYWYAGGTWNSAELATSGVVSKPVVVLQPDGAPSVFYEGSGGSLWNYWYGAGTWNSSVVTASGVVSTPVVVLQTDGAPSVFFQGPGNSLLNYFYNAGTWGAGTVAGSGSAFGPPAVGLQTDGAPTVFFQGPGNSLLNYFYNAGTWGAGTVAGSGSAFGTPVVVPQTDGAPSVFFQGPGNSLLNYWYSAGTWGAGTVAGSGSIFSAPGASLQTDGAPTVFFEGPGNSLLNYWYSAGTWGAATVAGSGLAFGDPAVFTQSGGAPSVFFQGPSNSLLNYFYSGGTWGSTIVAPPGATYP